MSKIFLHAWHRDKRLASRPSDPFYKNALRSLCVLVLWLLYPLIHLIQKTLHYLFSSSLDSPPAPPTIYHHHDPRAQTPQQLLSSSAQKSPFSLQGGTREPLPTHQKKRHLPVQKKAPLRAAQPSSPPPEEGCASLEPEYLGSLEALKALQNMSSSLNPEGRAAAIQTLLKDNKLVFAALRTQRWPEGVRCPRCHSHRVVRRYPPKDQTLLMPDQWFYRCLDCEGQGHPAEFDDSTDLTMLHSTDFVRQWISVYYLSSFCTPAKLSLMLGISPELLTQLMYISQNLTDQFKKEQSEEEDTRARRHNRALKELIRTH